MISMTSMHNCSESPWEDKGTFPTVFTVKSGHLLKCHCASNTKFFFLYLDNILRYNIPYLIMCYGHLCVFFCSGTNKQTKSDIKRQPKRNRKRKQLFGDIFGDNSGFGEISPLKLTKSTNISGNDPCVAPAVTVQSKLASIELSNPDSEEDGCTIEPAPSSVIKTILSKPAAVYTDRKIASMRKGDSTAVKQATKCFFL